MNQFFFKHIKQLDGVDENGAPKFEEIIISFNVDNVLSTAVRNGKMGINLNDWHEEWREIEVGTNKGGTRKEMRKMMVTSYFELKGEDMKRYINATDVNRYDALVEEQLDSQDTNEISEIP